MLLIRSQLLDGLLGGLEHVIFAVVHANNAEHEGDVDNGQKYPPHDAFIEKELCHEQQLIFIKKTCGSSLLPHIIN